MLLGVSGCSLSEGGYTRLKGPPLDPDPVAVAAYSARQTAILAQFATNLWGPGITLPPSGDPAWGAIVEEGINYSKHQCEAFIGAIFEWHRQREAARTELALLGSTTTTILATLKTAQTAIAITSAAFGLASGTLVTISDSVLFKIEPSGVRRIVERDQAAYLIELQKGVYTTRPGAVRAIAGFHALCLPARLEAQVNESISGSKTAVAPPPAPNMAPIVAQAEELPELVVSYQLDNSAAVIKGAMYRDGGAELDVAGLARLRKCMGAGGVTASIEDLLFQKKFTSARMAVAKCLAQ